MAAECLGCGPVPVTVAPGKVMAGVRIEDWYANSDCFPAEATLAPLMS